MCLLKANYEIDYRDLNLDELMKWSLAFKGGVVTNALIRKFLTKVKERDFGSNPSELRVWAKATNKETQWDLIRKYINEGKIRAEEFFGFVCSQEDLNLRMMQIHSYENAHLSKEFIEQKAKENKEIDDEIIGKQILKIKVPQTLELVLIYLSEELYRFKYAFPVERSKINKSERVPFKGELWSPWIRDKKRKTMVVDILPKRKKILVRTENIKEKEFDSFQEKALEEIEALTGELGLDSSNYIGAINRLREEEKIESHHLKTRRGELDMEFKHGKGKDIFTETNNNAFALLETDGDETIPLPIHYITMRWKKLPKNLEQEKLINHVNCNNGKIRFGSLGKHPGDIVWYVLRHLDDAFI